MIRKIAVKDRRKKTPRNGIERHRAPLINMNVCEIDSMRWDLLDDFVKEKTRLIILGQKLISLEFEL